MSVYELSSLVIQFLSALFVFGGLLYAGRQISLLKATHKQNHEWNRRIETQKALAEYNQAPIAQALNEEFDHINAKHPIPLKQILEKFQDNGKLQLQCHVLLNSYESFARGVHLGIYDEEVLRSARKNAITRTYTAYKEYISYRQRENNPLIYKELDVLIERWQNQERKPSKKRPLGDLA